MFLKIDFRKFFNMLRRDAIQEATGEHFPELLPNAESTISCLSDLQFQESILLSKEGAQEGDRVGHLCFCLAYKERLETFQSELILGYLDDLAVGDTAEIVLKNIITHSYSDVVYINLAGAVVPLADHVKILSVTLD